MNETDTPTPRTDALLHKLRHQYKLDEKGFKQIEKELTAAREELKAVTEQRDDFRKEVEIVNGRLLGKRHPDDNGIMVDGEIDIKQLIEQRDSLHELHNKNAAHSAELLELCRTLREQRDRLAAALKEIHRSTGTGTDGEWARDNAHKISSIAIITDDDARKTINLNKWQLIETAPKDGSQIIGCDGLNYYICHWTDISSVDSQKTQYGWATDYDDGGMQYNFENPTHWISILPFQQVIQSLNQNAQGMASPGKTST